MQEEPVSRAQKQNTQRYRNVTRFKLGKSIVFFFFFFFVLFFVFVFFSFFRSQILEREYWPILEHISIPALLAIGQYCHVLDLTNIQELKDTGI